MISRHFLPGNDMTIQPEWRRDASPRFDRVRVYAPGRVHASVFNFDNMTPGLGGGGLGVSVDTAGVEIEIAFGAPAASPMSATARHLVALFKRCVGYAGDDIVISTHGRIRQAHSGFGSNVSFNTAVIAGLNALFGSQFSVGEVWNMVTRNYVENAADGSHVYLGFDTGVGEACVLHGGLVWIDEGSGPGQGRYLGNIPTENLWVVTAVGDAKGLAGPAIRALGESAANGLGDDAEGAIVAGVCKAYQRRYGAELRVFLDREMLPAMLRGDLPELLHLGWKLHAIGGMRVLQEIYRPDVLQALIEEMRKAGSPFAGMSSAGPGFFAFAENEARAIALRSILAECFSGYFRDFNVGRAGSRLTIDVSGYRPAASVQADSAAA